MDCDGICINSAHADAKKGTCECQCHRRLTQCNEFGNSAPRGAKTCSRSAITSASPGLLPDTSVPKIHPPKGTEVRWLLPEEPVTQHMVPGESGKDPALPVRAVSGSGSDSAMGRDRLLRTHSCSFIPSHWLCRSPFFQIISFLAPDFANWDSASLTQPFHLVSRAAGTFPLKIITTISKKTDYP